MYSCDYCDATFPDKAGIASHLDKESHWAECETCNKRFRTIQDPHNHMNGVCHWIPTFPCETCDEVFYSRAAAIQHMPEVGHWKTYCKNCDRYFMNENDLQTHRNSEDHRETTLPCLLCNFAFATMTEVIQHLLIGACPCAPALSPSAILTMLQCPDPTGPIANQIIEYPQSASAQCHITASAFNGTGWECYICHKEFKWARSLSRHLDSSAHQMKVYHCHNRNCGMNFAGLARLYAHIESEFCGMRRFKIV